MNDTLLRLFLPVAAGILLGLFASVRGFLRARAAAPGRPGFVRLLAGLSGGVPAVFAMIGGIIALQQTN